MFMSEYLSYSTPRLLSGLLEHCSSVWENHLNCGTSLGRSFNVNISEEESAIIVTCELGGINKEDIDVCINKDILTIKAERKTSTDCKDFCEIYSGLMSRSFKLPSVANSNEVQAKLSDGILTLTIGKTKTEQTLKKIPILN